MHSNAARKPAARDRGSCVPCWRRRCGVVPSPGFTRTKRSRRRVCRKRRWPGISITCIRMRASTRSSGGTSTCRIRGTSRTSRSPRRSEVRRSHGPSTTCRTSFRRLLRQSTLTVMPPHGWRTSPCTRMAMGNAQVDAACLAGRHFPQISSSECVTARIDLRRALLSRASYCVALPVRPLP